MSENENLPNLETPSNKKILEEILKAAKHGDDFINALNQVFDKQS